MAKTYTGSEIVAKIEQATELLEKGTPPKEIWSHLDITRQTYNRWKQLYDAIRSKFESSATRASKKMDLLTKQVAQLKDKLKEAQNQVRKLKGQQKAAEQKLGKAADVQAELDKANAKIALGTKKVTQLESQLKTARTESKAAGESKEEFAQVQKRIVRSEELAERLEKKLAFAESELKQYVELQKEHQQLQDVLEESAQQVGDTNDLREQLTQTVNEKMLLGHSVVGLRAQVSGIQSQLGSEKETREQLELRHSEDQKRLQVLTAELDQLRAGQVSLLNAPSPGVNVDPPEAARQGKPAAMDGKLQQEGERYRQMLAKDLSEDSLSAENEKQNSWLGKLYQNARSLCYDQTCPIGVEFEDECITLVQLSTSRDGMSLIDAKKLVGPYGIDVESGDWGKWAINGLKEVMRGSKFKGRKVSMALPVRDTYIDHLIIPQGEFCDYPKEIFERMQDNLPYEATFENTIIKYMPTEGDCVLAIALERQRVERYVAMCEHAKLKPRVFSVWPMAMANCYSLLWTRKDDSFVMLFDVAMHYTNIVICRGSVLYYARTIPVGAQDLETGSMMGPLSDQIAESRAQFTQLYGEHRIRKNIFFAGQAADREMITRIVKNSRMSAQMGDPFGVIKISYRDSEAVDANKCRPSWSVAFGLSLQPRINEPLTKQLLHA